MEKTWNETTVFLENKRANVAKGDRESRERRFGGGSKYDFGGSEYGFEGESRPTATFFGKKAEKSRFFLFFVTINVKRESLNRKMCPFDSTISTELS